MAEITKTTNWRCTFGLHKWSNFMRDERHCNRCERRESYSNELGGWYDLGYLAGTNYDNGEHMSKL